jgi:hypothetical protein
MLFVLPQCTQLFTQTYLFFLFTIFQNHTQFLTKQISHQSQLLLQKSPSLNWKLLKLCVSMTWWLLTGFISGFRYWFQACENLTFVHMAAVLLCSIMLSLLLLLLLSQEVSFILINSCYVMILWLESNELKMM